MASQAVIAAVNARLGNPWMPTTLPPDNALQVLDQNAPLDFTGNDPFLQVQYPIANAEQKSIGTPGSNVWRETGAIRFVLGVLRSSGTNQGVGWCDDLSSLFRGKQFGGVNTWAPSSPVIDSSNDLGNYFLLTFAVPYYFDFIG